MKKLIIILAIVFMASIACADPPRTMGWDANSDSDLAGYRIYFTENPGQYQFGGNTSPNFLAEIPCPPNDTACAEYNKPSLSGIGYYYVCVAYDTDGFESLPSNEINSLPPGAPVNHKWK